jgi:hypothetical protein
MIKTKKLTEAEVKNTVDRASTLAKQLASHCHGKSLDDVLQASVVFLSNTYAMRFGETRRERMSDLIYAQLSRDMNEGNSTKEREYRPHTKEQQPRGEPPRAKRSRPAVTPSGHHVVNLINPKVKIVFFDGKVFRNFRMRFLGPDKPRECMMPLLEKESRGMCGASASADCEWSENGIRVGMYACSKCFEIFFLPGMLAKSQEGKETN